MKNFLSIVLCGATLCSMVMLQPCSATDKQSDSVLLSSTVSQALENEPEMQKVMEELEPIIRAYSKAETTSAKRKIIKNEFRIVNSEIGLLDSVLEYRSDKSVKDVRQSLMVKSHFLIKLLKETPTLVQDILNKLSKILLLAIPITFILAKDNCIFACLIQFLLALVIYRSSALPDHDISWLLAPYF